jgi:hypothetical protein
MMRDGIHPMIENWDILSVIEKLVIKCVLVILIFCHTAALHIIYLFVSRETPFIPKGYVVHTKREPDPASPLSTT